MNPKSTIPELTISALRKTFLKKHMTTRYGVVSMKFRKYLNQGLEHESIVLDTVPVEPGLPAIAKPNTAHTYVEFGRFKAKDTPFFSVNPLSPAEDRAVVGNEENAAHDQVVQPTVLSTVTWTYDLSDLLDVIDIILHISKNYPRYNFVTRQCYWLAHVIYDTLRSTYSPYSEDIELAHRKKQGMLYSLLPACTSSPPSDVLEYARSKKQFRETVRQVEGTH